MSDGKEIRVQSATTENIRMLAVAADAMVRANPATAHADFDSYWAFRHDLPREQKLQHKLVHELALIEMLQQEAEAEMNRTGDESNNKPEPPRAL